jgi:hypothetical protein
MLYVREILTLRHSSVKLVDSDLGLLVGSKLHGGLAF